MAKLVPDYVTSLREALSSFYDEVRKFNEDQGDGPAPSSQAANEQAESQCPESQCPESLVSAWAIATPLIESGGEHVTAFVKMITEPIEPIACWICVRSMLESCALASWLLDPGINATERVGRVFALRFEGLEQQLKFGRVAGVSNSELEAAEKRIDDVEQIAINLDYPRVVNSRDKRIGIGQKMPSATEVIRVMLDEEAMYRLLSAVAHGHFWAIRELSYKPMTDHPGGLHVGGVPVSAFEKTPNIKGMAYLGLGAAKALARPLWHQCSYFGWNKVRLMGILDSAFDKLHATPGVRFWRSPSS